MVRFEWYMDRSFIDDGIFGVSCNVDLYFDSVFLYLLFLNSVFFFIFVLLVCVKVFC